MKKSTEKLILHNVENLRWALLQNINDTFHGFSVDFEERLMEIKALTQGAIKAAQLRKEEDSNLIDQELEHLQNIAANLVVVQKALISH